MKDFIPSDDFTEKVMREVRTLARSSTVSERTQAVWSHRPVRILFSTTATLLGSWNLIRLYFTFFYPVVCR